MKIKDIERRIERYNYTKAELGDIITSPQPLTQLYIGRYSGAPAIIMRRHDPHTGDVREGALVVPYVQDAAELAPYAADLAQYIETGWVASAVLDDADDAPADDALSRVYTPPFDSDDVPQPAPQIGGDHYQRLEPQPITVIERWSLGYHEGNIIKYIARWRAKGGVDDLRKARWYLDRLIELQQKEGQK